LFKLICVQKFDDLWTFVFFFFFLNQINYIIFILFCKKLLKNKKIKTKMQEQSPESRKRESKELQAIFDTCMFQQREKLVNVKIDCRPSMTGYIVKKKKS
jgi:hypothetical protein